jgi:hypothetical protein
VTLAAEALAKLAPAVERPGIHLGVAQTGDTGVWGTTRTLRGSRSSWKWSRLGCWCQVPARHHGKVRQRGCARRRSGEGRRRRHGAPRFEAPAAWGHSANVFVRLAVSMRAHGRGGSLLVVPAGTDRWRKSIVQPIRYSVAPPCADRRADAS